MPTQVATPFSNGTTNATVDSTSAGVAQVGDVFVLIAMSHDYVPPTWKFKTGGGTFETEDNSNPLTPVYGHDNDDVTHTGCQTSSTSSYVTDAACTATSYELLGRRVTGAGIPAGAYVGEITSGQFRIVDSSGVLVNGTSSGSGRPMRFGSAQDASGFILPGVLIHSAARQFIAIWTVKITAVTGSPTPIVSMSWVGATSGSARRFMCGLYRPDAGVTPPNRALRHIAFGTLVDAVTGTGIHNWQLSPTSWPLVDCVAILAREAGAAAGVPHGDFDGNNTYTDTDSNGTASEATAVWSTNSSQAAGALIGCFDSAAAHYPGSATTVALGTVGFKEDTNPSADKCYAALIIAMEPPPPAHAEFSDKSGIGSTFARQSAVTAAFADVSGISSTFGAGVTQSAAFADVSGISSTFVSTAAPTATFSDKSGITDGFSSNVGGRVTASFSDKSGIGSTFGILRTLHAAFADPSGIASTLSTASGLHVAFADKSGIGDVLSVALGGGVIHPDTGDGEWTDGSVPGQRTAIFTNVSGITSTLALHSTVGVTFADVSGIGSTFESEAVHVPDVAVGFADVSGIRSSFAGHLTRLAAFSDVSGITTALFATEGPQLVNVSGIRSSLSTAVALGSHPHGLWTVRLLEPWQTGISRPWSARVGAQ